MPIESVIHLDTENGIGYLKVDRFSETTHDEFLGHLEQLSAQGMNQLIVDLRDNPGGYLHEAVAMADEFLGEGKLIVTTRYRNGSVKNSEAKSGNRFESMPVHIIIDENSASASEVFTGALQDHDRATVYGKTSFGKGLVQEDKLLEDGSKVRLTVAYYYTPSGRSIQKPYKEDEVFNEGVFLSDTGRILYSQGGIEPDVELQYGVPPISGRFLLELLTRLDLNLWTPQESLISTLVFLTSFQLLRFRIQSCHPFLNLGLWIVFRRFRCIGQKGIRTVVEGRNSKKFMGF